MMDPITAGLLLIAAMLVLVALGVPVAIAIGGAATAGMWLFGGASFMLTNLETLPYNIASQYAFVAIPMFILMGALTASAGITKELYDAAYRWTAGLRGSLYYATTLASAGFAAINGATIVSALVFTRIALPEMLRLGYNKSLSAGCICAAGTFAALIPPSIPIIIYALLVGESVGQVLMAGIVPGIVTVALYMIGLAILLRIRPDLAPNRPERFSLKEKMQSLRGLWAVVFLFLVVIGGIYAGLMFPSAAGAVGAAGALLIGIARRTLGKSEIAGALRETVISTAVLFLIIIAGLLFSRALLVTGFITGMTEGIRALSVKPWMFIGLVIVLYIILGMFVDTISMMVMTLPFLFPISKQIGIDPIWFGIIVVKLVEIGVITPPVGLNLYAVLTASEGRVTSKELFRGVAPFLVFESIALALIWGFPEMSLWLPKMMMKT